LINHLSALGQVCGKLTVGLESTGSYSEAVRRALTQASITTHRIRGKSVADYREIFDGVPSQHDGKDAAMIAELTSFGKGTPWPFVPRTAQEEDIHFQVRRYDSYLRQHLQWLNRVEGMLSQHWPELTTLLELGSSTVLQICLKYGSAANLHKDGESRSTLKGWGRGALSWAKVESIVESAGSTQGVPMGESDVKWLQEIASEVLQAREALKDSQRKMQQLAASHPAMQRYVKAVGGVTLCVLWALVGDPRKYESSGAFIKAIGLNLKELSSGQRQGQLAISKRGPSGARRLLYFWALRSSQDSELSKWYREFCRVGRKANSTQEYRKLKGLVALMRKLCASLWHCCRHEEDFVYGRVFPGKPLQVRRPRNRRKLVSQTQS
jgi:transposase